MRHPRLVLAAASLAIVAVAAGWLIWVAAPVAAPTASDGAAASGSPRAVAGPPPPVGWGSVRWLPPTIDPLGPPDPLRRIDGLAGADDGVIGWGRTPMEGRNQFNDMGAVFLSADAVTWRTVPIDDGVGPLNASTISDVAAGALGYLAVGNVCCNPEELALWRSADGLAWERIEPAGGLQPMTDVAISVLPLPDGWLLLGGSRVEPGSTIWRSDDGEAWQAVLEVGEGGSLAPIADVVATRTGFTAVGTVVGDGGSYDGGVWSSVDGRSWERIGADDPALVGEGEVQLFHAWSHAGGLFAAGLHGTAEQRRQCEEIIGMHASIEDRPPLPPPFDATSCQPGEERTFASVDGLVWQRVDPAGGVDPQPIEFRVIAAGGPGLVLLGESSLAASPDTMLFTSPDGVTWTAMDDGAPLLADVALGLVVRGNAIVAVTDRWTDVESTLRIWVGSAE